MARLKVNNDKIHNKKELIEICPFDAIEEVNGKIEINAACRMCKICVKQGPEGAIEYIEDEVEEIDKSKWNGIAVCVDHLDGEIHPVTYELIGKAKELAAVIDHPVYALMIGSDISDKAEEILHYGVDKVFIYDKPELKRFRIEPHATAFVDFIEKIKPSSILVGSTTIGRQLAPRVAARMKTGLTADCTVLKIKENTDLVQIRPAFGGNIMAEIVTPNHRPQIATVRYKIMDVAERTDEKTGEIVSCHIDDEKLETTVDVIEIAKKDKEKSIEESDVLVVAGRGVKNEDDLKMLEELADLLGAQVACTRPLCEAGWFKNTNQIGLSGRTVRPELIITCGVMGAVQFIAGMGQAGTIISINEDENAPIFNTAHYGLVGDLYEIIPDLIEKIKLEKGA